ncbi:MAG: hypothetical protein K1060chlam5_01207 [Candidatus Anoxychlamydiales bacterium]|nr:hypothetical protein [Candidatus Anoxychlamydiales bacterium]
MSCIMFRRFFILASVIFISACTTQGYSQKNSNKILDFKEAHGKYTIIVVQNKQNYSEMKEEALKRAARLCLDNNFKYFDITKEKHVYIMLGKENFPSSYDFPQNLYQEDIVEKGYNRERFIQRGKRDGEMHKALKINIQCSTRKLAGYKDPCDFVKCN